MKKFAIWGPPASGKTTLAAKLGELLNIDNIIRTDDLLFDKNWKIVEESNFIEKVSPLLEKEEWIVEGNLGSYYTREEILKMADLVIILNPKTIVLKYRIWKRSFFRWLKHTAGKTKKPSRADPPIGLKKNIQELTLITNNFKKNYFFKLLDLIDNKNLQNKTKIVTNKSELQVLINQLKSSV